VVGAPTPPVPPVPPVLPVGAAVTVTVADAAGSLGKWAALTLAVSWTDVTLDAVAAIATRAWSWRWDELASTAPRSHDEVPSWLPQPKLNLGVTLEGDATSRTMASGTFPPFVQALTIHWADCPRWMLACVRCTPTQRLTCAGRAALLVDVLVVDVLVVDALLVNATPRIARAAALGWEPRDADAEGPVVGDG